MKKLLIALLFTLPTLALADGQSQAANERFARVLDEVGGTKAGFSPRIGRLIGWPAADLRPLAEPERLARLIEESWAWLMQVEPEWATFTGYPGQNGRWSDLSAEALAARQALEARFLATLEAMDPELLGESDRLNLALLRWRMRHAVAGHAFPDELMPVNQMFGLQSQIPQVLGAQPLFTAEDRSAFLQRLQGVPVLLAQLRLLLEAGLARGLTPPQITLAKVPQQFIDLAPENGRDSPLLKGLKNLPQSLGDEQRRVLEQRALELYANEIRPALLGLYVYIRDTYLPQAVRATGLSNLPDGKAWYAHAARGYTTTDLSPEDIHEIGQREVKRIRAEMKSVMKELGFHGTIPAFANKLAKDRRWYFDDEDEFLNAYRALGKRVDALLPKAFRRFAALPYGIEAVPEFVAKGSAAAYYLPGSAEFGRPGVFYVNTVRMAESPKYEMEALLLHEAVPGHHFQIALAQEIQNVPEFRKHGRFTAYTEGWGLYAESLGKELGLYTDPHYRFGALSYEIWRAIRLVVDTGMHALGWSREDAIQFFAENTGRDRGRIEAEVDRYLVLPGQALAYKIGELKIRELRRHAEEVLGDDFDVRAFHDQVLGAGSMPLSVLEHRLRAWVVAQSPAAAEPAGETE